MRLSLTFLWALYILLAVFSINVSGEVDLGGKAPKKRGNEVHKPRGDFEHQRHTHKKIKQCRPKTRKSHLSSPASGKAPTPPLSSLLINSIGSSLPVSISKPGSLSASKRPSSTPPTSGSSSPRNSSPNSSAIPSSVPKSLSSPSSAPLSSGPKSSAPSSPPKSSSPPRTAPKSSVPQSSVPPSSSPKSSAPPSSLPETSAPSSAPPSSAPPSSAPNSS